MAELAVDRTYGSALFQAANELGKIEQIEQEARAVGEIFHQEPDFCRVIDSPSVSKEEKKEMLCHVFGRQISRELLNFLYVLVDNRRTQHYDAIFRVYQKQKEEKKGLKTGVVYSVLPLTEEQVQELERQTSKLLQHHVRLKNQTDPTLIGGVRILVDGKMIDASLKERLETMRRQLQP